MNKLTDTQIKHYRNQRDMTGWQCPECYGIQINHFESRFGGLLEDRFECNECGCTWHRDN